jgi:hypothetical protein
MTNSTQQEILPWPANKAERKGGFFHITPCRVFLPAALAALLATGRGLIAQPIAAEGERPVMLQERGAGEGPAWHPELGLLTSGGGHIYRRAKDGTVSIQRPAL